MKGDATNVAELSATGRTFHRDNPTTIHSRKVLDQFELPIEHYLAIRQGHHHAITRKSKRSKQVSPNRISRESAETQLHQ